MTALDMHDLPAATLARDIDWASARRNAGLTLRQASERAGYKPSTINGLEKNGEGSARLKRALTLAYSITTTPHRYGPH